MPRMKFAPSTDPVRAAGVPRNPIIPLPDRPIIAPPAEEPDYAPEEESWEDPGVPGEPVPAEPVPAEPVPTGPEPALPGVP